MLRELLNVALPVTDAARGPRQTLAERFQQQGLLHSGISSLLLELVTSLNENHFLTVHSRVDTQQLEELCSALDSVQSGLSRHLAFIKSKEGVGSTESLVDCFNSYLTDSLFSSLWTVHPQGNGERRGPAQDGPCRWPDVSLLTLPPSVSCSPL
jgi:hypothetical protein